MNVDWGNNDPIIGTNQYKNLHALLQMNRARFFVVYSEKDVSKEYEFEEEKKKR